MPNTWLFAAGEDSELTILNGGMVTTAGAFRPAMARAAIGCTGFNAHGAQHQFSGDLAAYLAAQPLNDKEFWYGYRWVGGGGFIIGGISFRMYDFTGKEWLRLRGQGASDQQLQLSTNGFGSSLVNYPASTIVQPSTPVEYCFRIKKHATDGVIEWWINGGLWFTTPTMDTTGFCVGSPDKVIFGCPNSNGVMYVSEIRASAATRSCVGADIFTADYTADGDDTDWAGAVAGINEISEDTSTVVSSDAAGQDSSFIARPVPTLSGNTAIQALVTSGKWRTSVGSPQNLKHYLRIAGTNYAGATLAVPGVSSTLQTVWETSPATTDPFTVTELNATQRGMRSVT